MIFSLPVRDVVDDGLAQLAPQVARLLGHVGERAVQLLRRAAARVVEVLAEQVLQKRVGNGLK